MREFLSRLRFFFSRGPTDGLDEEVQFHLEQATQANIAAGMPPQEARRRALIAFGGIERTREQTHEQHPRWLLGTLMQDIRYALRGFRRNPLFTITVIATLGLGIGATTAVFSVVDPILFRPLPYGHADRLVSVGLVHGLQREPFMLGGFYYNWKDNQKPFEALTSQAYGAEKCNLTQPIREQLNCTAVEANFLPTLGVKPLLGRNFLPEEDRPNGPNVALISYQLWRNRFNSDPGILNKLVQIDGSPARVIGVLPADFELPTLDPIDLLVPRDLDEAAQRKANIGGAPMRAFARLKPGVCIAQAKSQLQPLLQSTLSFAPPFMRKQIFLSVRSMRDFQMHNVYWAAWILLGAVLAVLLIACANVASLLLTRGTARERELTMRFVLGATRGRLIRQTLTGTFLLALSGAVAGCVLAEILLHIFVAIAPAGIFFLGKARIDLRIILFTLSVSIVCAAFFGIVPALQRPDAARVGTISKISAAPARFRRSLVVAQIAISMVLLSATMLLLRSFWNLEGQNLGMRTRHILTVSIATSDRYGTGRGQMEFYRHAELALRRLPGVSAVGLSDSIPPGGWQNGGWSGRMAVAGRPKPTEEDAGNPILWRWATPDYFRALNTPIFQGQNFTEEERNSNGHFAILSKLLATRMFPKGEAIGQSIKPDKNDPWYLVVGVAENVKNSGLAGQNKPEYYRLRRNFVADWDPNSWGIHSVIVMESALEPAAVAPSIRSQISRIDPMAQVEIETLNRRVSKLAARPRFDTTLLGFFAFFGLLISVIALYGVIAFVATQRTQEIGVRMALGASRFNILRLILWEGARLIALGAIVGLVAALALSHVLKSLLFKISPYDPSSFFGVTLLLIVVALLATLVPALSAMKVDPVVALRHE